MDRRNQREDKEAILLPLWEFPSPTGITDYFFYFLFRRILEILFNFLIQGGQEKKFCLRLSLPSNDPKNLLQAQQKFKLFKSIHFSLKNFLSRNWKSWRPINSLAFLNEFKYLLQENRMLLISLKNPLFSCCLDVHIQINFIVL